MRKATLVVLIATAALFAASPRLAVAAIVDTAAASAPDPDPAEKLNRKGYAIHQFFDRILIRPAAMAYMAAMPRPLRLGIENVLNNLGEPVVAANDLIQGRFRKAGTSTVRFVTNSTVGVAGLFDVAKRAGLPRHDNGFALTLGRAGVRPGPYLFIPLVGPSTVRDAIGSGVDAVTNPFHWIARRQSETVIVSTTVVAGLDARSVADSELTALLGDATDPYATLRSVYLQNQQSQVDDKDSSALPALPDFDDDNATPAAPSPQGAKAPG